MGGVQDAVMDALSSKRVGLSLDLGLYERTISGDCSPADLECQLRLVHLAFTAQAR